MQLDCLVGLCRIDAIEQSSELYQLVKVVDCLIDLETSFRTNQAINHWITLYFYSFGFFLQWANVIEAPENNTAGNRKNVLQYVDNSQESHAKPEPSPTIFKDVPRGATPQIVFHKAVQPSPIQAPRVTFMPTLQQQFVPASILKNNSSSNHGNVGQFPAPATTTTPNATVRATPIAFDQYDGGNGFLQRDNVQSAVRNQNQASVRATPLDFRCPQQPMMTQTRPLDVRAVAPVPPERTVRVPPPYGEAVAAQVCLIFQC